MKKACSLWLALTLLLALMSGCASGDPSDEPLRVGTMASTLGVPIQYALDKGFFEEEGLEVEIVVFSSGAPINEAIAAGELDVAVSGMASIFSLATGNVTLVSEVSSTGGIGLYARPDSDIVSQQTLPDLPNVLGSADTVKGKTFLGPLSTSSQHNAVKYAELFGLSSSDITMIHMDFGPALQAFLTGEGDVLATCPPYSYQAVSEGLVEIATFEDSTGSSLNDLVFVRNQVMEERRDDIVSFVKCMMEASEELQADREMRGEYSRAWYEENGKTTSQEDMDQEMDERYYLTRETLSSDDYVFAQAQIPLGEFFVDDGKITEANFPNIEKSFDTSVIKDALGIEVKEP